MSVLMSKFQYFAICFWRGVKGCKSDRFGQELSNDYVAKIGVDKAVNELIKICFVFKVRDVRFIDPPRTLPPNTR